MKTKLFLLAIIVCWASISSAQVVINEISAANYDGGFTDNYGEEEDWFELYNPTGADVNIGGYYFSDDDTEPMKWEIPAGVIVPANGYLLVYASGRGEFAAGNVHTDFKITQAKQEGAVLADASGTIVDSYMLNIANQEGHSRGRTTDGGANWGIMTTPTPGAANAGVIGEYAELEIETAPGYYTGSVDVTITTATAGAEIRYTLDGSVPTAASTLYGGPVTISQTTTLRARAFHADANIPESFIETNTYFIDVTHTLPIICVSGDQLQVLLDGTQIEPIGHFEYFDSDGTLLAECGGDYNEHGNDSWAYPQRGIDYITQDEFGYGNEIDYPIFRTKDREGYQRVIIKAAASDNYPFENGGAHIRDAYVQSLSQIADLRMDERSYEPCIMYCNGQYWGVYEVREKVDDLDFTDYYYDQGSGQVDFLKTWGGTWEEYGSADEWDDLRDYILGNDMTDAGNYDYVKGLYNTGSLIDYFTLNSYTVCSDWLNWNTAWWRGKNPDGDKKKWRYVLWDMDATFGHYANFTGIPDQSANANICDPQQIGDPGGQGHVPIWNTLIENEEFFADYINRFSDLSGSYFSCEFMIHHLDSLVALIEPEMQMHVDRWGGTYAEWESNVQEVRDFINDRCAVINDGFLDCYDELEGPYEITLMANPPEGGRIDLPSMEIDTYPFTTTYFGGVDVPFDADENDGFTFSHWSSNNNAITPDATLEEIVMNFTSNDTLIAHFIPDVTYQVVLDVAPANTGSITVNGLEYTNFPVTVDLPGDSPIDIQATAIPAWDFENWTSTVAMASGNLAATNNFTLTEGATITANFYEVIYNVHFEVSPPDVGAIDLDGETIDPLPQELSLAGNVPFAVSAYPTREFYEFTDWNIISANPIPDANTSDVELSFGSSDLVIANFIELANYPLIVDTKPRDVARIKVESDVITEFPFQKNYLAEEPLFIEVFERDKWKFSHWEVVHGAPINFPLVLAQNYILSTSTKLVAHFEERLNNVWIPNSFTPNEDGVNDVLKIYYEEIQLDDFKFIVMDRWGNEVWSTTDPNVGWNGSNEGGDYYVDPGVYAYFIRYVDSITKKIVETHGHVTVVR